MTTDALSDVNGYPPAGERVSLSAAYTDSTAARAVVEDLERAGLHPTFIVPLGSSWATAQPSAAGTLFEHPWQTSAVGAMTLGAITGFGNLVWLDGRHWVLYVSLGVLLGALTGWIASALAATAHPAREEDLLAYPGGGMTIEVEADEPGKARLAEAVMGRHDPTIFKARTRPGPRPPQERVMWQHEAGLSPLEALGSWFEDTRSGPGPRPRRGRHLQADHLRP